MTDDELRSLIIQAQQKASVVCTRHGLWDRLWDTIFDAEAILAGQQSLCSRDVVERQLVEACRNM